MFHKYSLNPCLHLFFKECVWRSVLEMKNKQDEIDFADQLEREITTKQLLWFDCCKTTTIFCSEEILKSI